MLGVKLRVMLAWGVCGVSRRGKQFAESSYESVPSFRWARRGLSERTCTLTEVSLFLTFRGRSSAFWPPSGAVVCGRHVFARVFEQTVRIADSDPGTEPRRPSREPGRVGSGRSQPRSSRLGGLGFPKRVFFGH